MKLILPEFKHAKVMIIGDVILDRYLYGSTVRISPEAPVPIVKISSVEDRPGGAANVAMNIASLGASSHLIAFTGIDDAADALIKSLANTKVKYNFISIPTYKTNTKLRIISRNQQLIRLDFEKNNFEDLNQKNILYKYAYRALDDVGSIVLSDYAKGTFTSNVQQLIKLAHKKNIPILIDPKHSNFKNYRGATLLTPNLSEFEAVVGKCKNEEEIIKRGKKLINDFEINALLLTRSEQGMTLLQSDKPIPIHMPTQVHKVYDVTGAGDTVISVLAATLAVGNSLEDACYFANTAASIVVNKLGTSTISSIELKNAICSKSEISFGIVNSSKLKVAVSEARKRGEKIVMTNGVFDILHVGHINYLTNARKLGDRLIVAVNSDASTKRLKGNTRPINQLKQRMIVLSALEVVDWVVPFEEDTPQRLIADILPDILVKGGDYKSEKQIAGYKEVCDNNGKVLILNFENGYSTTNIIKQIKSEK